MGAGMAGLRGVGTGVNMAALINMAVVTTMAVILNMAVIRGEPWCPNPKKNRSANRRKTL